MLKCHSTSHSIRVSCLRLSKHWNVSIYLLNNNRQWIACAQTSPVSFALENRRRLRAGYKWTKDGKGVWSNGEFHVNTFQCGYMNLCYALHCLKVKICTNDQRKTTGWRARRCHSHHRYKEVRFIGFWSDIRNTLCPHWIKANDSTRGLKT